MFSFTKSKHGFSSLRQDSESEAEQDRMLEHGEYSEKRNLSGGRRFWSSNIPWIFTTIILFLYIVASSIYQRRQRDLLSPTELRPARHLIEESFQRFTAGLDYNNENRTLQHTPHAGTIYIGPPSPEVDAAWEDAAGIQEIYLTREEAVAAGVEETYMDPLTKLYEVEVESFHHIHCLNYIRKSLDIDKYPDLQDQADTWRIHADHCIDSIREFIMCKGDMTPIVLIRPEVSDVPVPLPEFRTTHVCRNFQKLKNWVKTERGVGGGKEVALKRAQKIREETGTKY